MTARVYIAGPMRGYVEHNIPAFREAAAHFRTLGFDVVSPVEIAELGGHADQSSRPAEAWVRDDLRELLTCDAMHLLDGWQASTGARCEASVAVTLGFAFVDWKGAGVPAPARIVIAGGYDRAPGITDVDDRLTEVAAIAVGEARRAMAKFPTWPTDPFHALAVVGEEVGEVDKGLVQLIYEPRKAVTREHVHAEAVQVAAMSLRFLLSIDAYDYTPGDQHAQQLARGSTGGIAESTVVRSLEQRTAENSAAIAGMRAMHESARGAVAEPIGSGATGDAE